MSDAEMIHEFHKEYVNNNVNPFLQIDKFWDNRRKNLYKIQLQVIGIYLGCWIFFISSIYIIGLFIAWIVAGFRLRKDLI